jgi:hypothetical protein
MTNTDLIFAFVTGTQLREHQATQALNIAETAARDGGRETVLLSYGVPIARRTDGDGNVFVDCFSQWSATTSAHQSEAYDLAKSHAASVHRVAYDDLTAQRFTLRTPPKQRRKPIGATL